jgi:para-aminobenzoate synthetase
MRPTLLIDNYDSYTYNVFQLLATARGREPIVIHNDAVSWTALSRWDFEAIVLSPGPGRPERWHDFGVCADILRSSAVPVLGICLGHQGLGHMLDGAVRSAPTVMHGRLSRVRHTGGGLFAGIPQDFSVVRYHSLAVTGPLGPDGRVIAWTDEGVVMGIEHQRRPLWGVQFHPESVASEHGRRLVENFYALAQDHRSVASPRASAAWPRASAATSPRASGAAPEHSAGKAHARARARGPSTSKRSLTLTVRSLAGEPSTELVFERLFGDAEYAFWLDSADAPTSLAQCSFLGTSAGPGRCVLEYDVEAGSATVRGARTSRAVPGSIFAVLERELAKRPLTASPPSGRGLLGGFVGYLGYECKADCGSPNLHRSDLPDAVLMLANRIVAVDHVEGRVHLLALSDAPSTPGGAPTAPDESLAAPGDASTAPTKPATQARPDKDALRWLEHAEQVVREVLAQADTPMPSTSPADRGRADSSGADASSGPVVFRCGRGREQYLADIARCQTALAAGESYEVCLTDQISTSASPEPWSLYRLLRRVNPAPFAAYLKLGELTVLSSSPERFLAIGRDRRVQARPIKGTAHRSPDPVEDERLRTELARDEKTYAEHLMIVDLLRNDLGRVCEPGSVSVPELMVVEPYASVHQLVSTISGVLERQRTPVQCVRACFPGGSMTGAPKLRTMGIIDDIERVARGVYSGAIGYFGLDGVVDLSIVIRTVVMRPGATTIGAGGAIVMQSDPAEEFDEILLKARAPMAAVARAVCGREGPDAFTVELEPSTGLAEAA